MRKISKTLAMMGLMAPVAANALGIGEIKLRSTLNQALNAEIPLVTSGAESLTDIKISIAPPDAFTKAGIERSYTLSKLRFSTAQRADGSSVIKITSSDIIREPFLNFLIEVNWPQGRLLREFTVLLDPPSSFPEETLAAPSAPETPSYSVREPATDSTGSARATRSSSRGAATSRRAVPEGQYTGPGYGPVRRDETLWSIAKTVNEDPDVGQEQMVLALFKANPEAFYRDDPNALKAGATLRVPDRATVLQLAGPARSESRRRAATEGRLTERRDERTAATEAQTQEGRLKLLSPADGKPGPEGAAPSVKDAQGKTKEDIALEVADTVKQENEEIRSRLSGLEQQLANMQRLLTLKEEQIASLQGQKVPPVPATEAPKHLEPVPEQGVPAVPSITREPAAPTEAPTPVATPVPSTPEPIPAKIPAPAPTPRAAKLPPPVAPSKAEPGFFDSISENPVFLAALGGGTLLIGAVVWLAMRRRAAMFDETESILSPSPVEKLADFQVSPSTRGADLGVPEPVAQAAKSSLLSEFTPSDFDALGSEADEVDPISEADVYLAYGRYKQAEELIQHAIEQHPDRDECKLKLLEIYYATENRQSFEAYAKELFEQNKDADHDFWDKIVEMGRELCPANPLFDTQGELPQGHEDADYMGLEQFGDIGNTFDLEDEFIAELKRFEDTRQARTAKTPSDSASEPYDPGTPRRSAEDELPGGSHEEGESSSKTAHDPASIEFELFPSPQSPTKQTTPARTGDEELKLDNMINFEPVRVETARREAPASEPPKGKRGNTLDDILVELGAKTELESETLGLELSTQSPESENLALEDHLGLGAVSPSLDLPASAAGEEEDLYESLTDMDAQETKLDLAKAYIDMGDEGTAREILEDVLKKGNDAQKEQAHNWIAKLASP